MAERGEVFGHCAATLTVVQAHECRCRYAWTVDNDHRQATVECSVYSRVSVG